MVSYLLIELFYIGMPVVWTDGRSVGRAYGHVITKISWMDRLPHFLRYGATLARTSRARGAPLELIIILYFLIYCNYYSNSLENNQGSNKIKDYFLLEGRFATAVLLMRMS